MSFKEGDRVLLKPRWSWSSGMKKLAEGRRPGTVKSVFTPLGSNQETICVQFDHKGGLSRNFTHYLRRDDLLPLQPEEPSDV